MDKGVSRSMTQHQPLNCNLGRKIVSTNKYVGGMYPNYNLDREGSIYIWEGRIPTITSTVKDQYIGGREESQPQPRPLK